MKYGRYGWSHLFLRISLGLVFLWIGIDILRHPTSWIGYLPQTLPLSLSRDLALQINGGLDVAIGTALILQFMPKITALIAALHLIGIIAIQGIDAVIIRDVGLLGASLALLTWPTHRRRRLFKFFKRKSRHEAYEEA